MANKKSRNTPKQREREKKRRRLREESQTLRDLRVKAPYIKQILKGRGCALRFYDYLDSYTDEFQRIAAAAKNAHHSLLGIHEVDDETFSAEESTWSKLGYGGLQQIFFSIDEEVAEYGRQSLDANLCGSMTSFHDADGNLRSVILIREVVNGSIQHADLKYALKVASLLHEIGHVEDLEQGMNFQVSERRLNVIEAEVFAHLYALRELAERHLVQSFRMLEGGLRDAIPNGGYLSEVARMVIDRMPPIELTDWQKVFELPPTRDELKRLGATGIRVLGSK